MMKKITSLILTFITIFVFATTSLSPIKVRASSATTYTHTFDNTGFLVRTQDAYLPGLVLTNLQLKSPNDLFVDNNNIFLFQILEIKGLLDMIFLITYN